jgi:hypothetical protein
MATLTRASGVRGACSARGLKPAPRPRLSARLFPRAGPPAPAERGAPRLHPAPGYMWPSEQKTRTYWELAAEGQLGVRERTLFPETVAQTPHDFAPLLALLQARYPPPPTETYVLTKTSVHPALPSAPRLLPLRVRAGCLQGWGMLAPVDNERFFVPAVKFSGSRRDTLDSRAVVQGTARSAPRVHPQCPAPRVHPQCRVDGTWGWSPQALACRRPTAPPPMSGAPPQRL